MMKYQIVGIMKLCYFYTKKLLSNSQHGYLKRKSIEKAIHEFIEEVTTAHVNKNISMGIFLDLSKDSAWVMKFC